MESRSESNPVDLQNPNLENIPAFAPGNENQENVVPEPVQDILADRSVKHGHLKFFAWLLLGVCLLVWLLLYLFFPRFQTKDFPYHLRSPYGEFVGENYGKICYGNFFNCQPATVMVEGSELDFVYDAIQPIVNIFEIGDHEVVYRATFEDKVKYYHQIITVYDDIAPEAKEEEGQAVIICPDQTKIASGLTIIDEYDGDITANVKIEIEDGRTIITASDSSGNTVIKNVPAIIKDDKAPIISLNGPASYIFELGQVTAEEGNIPAPTATDNCDSIELQRTGEINFAAPGTYTLTYTATDKAGNTATATRTVEIVPPNNGKIFLTFDDGPSEHTNRLLDVLKNYNVKATFFVTGSGSEDTLRRECNEGHAIGLHTFSHSYAYIYQNLNNFFEDLNHIKSRVETETSCTSNLIRFPGGSSNLVSRDYDGGSHIMSQLVNEVTRRGFAYFDWNVSSGDAGGATTSDEIFANVTQNLKYNDNSVVLQHDTKGFSVDAVEGIINYGLSHGYSFEKLTTNSFGAHHYVAN